MPSAIYTAMHLYDVVDLHLAIATSYVDQDRRTSLDNMDFFNTILGDYDERYSSIYCLVGLEDYLERNNSRCNIAAARAV